MAIYTGYLQVYTDIYNDCTKCYVQLGLCGIYTNKTN